jgi:hypothetical protein
VTPGPDAGSGTLAGFQDHHLLITSDQLGCGSQPDRPGAENGDGQGSADLSRTGAVQRIRHQSHLMIRCLSIQQTLHTDSTVVNIDP